MVKFLLKRPIAVIMAFLALVILGCVTFFTLPVSLLPDIDIPHISVQVEAENSSSRELENTVVAPLRRQLMQVGGLEEIRSETRDGSATISLTMQYGVDTDLAFIEVNEKIDAAMNGFPKDVRRPKAMKASATDIPVLYVNMTSSDGSGDFLQISDVADNIVRRRLEQLPEVAMVDVTGLAGKCLRIIPDNERLASAGYSVDDLEAAIAAGNAEPGSLTVRDGHYEYNIRISNQLRTPDEVRHIKLMKGGRMSELGDFCEVSLTERSPSGFATYGDRRAVTMAVIKQDAKSMGAMEDAVTEAVGRFSEQYPEITFSTSRSQTELLDFTISNLEQNLILGLILVFIVCAVFMRDIRLPFVIGLTIIAAVIITFLLFYLFHVSINIISLAGLILAIGMMIDNSVIVAENITQYRLRGDSVAVSCVRGTNEMITPMLSSSLTTVAVFVPLVFMSGIAGAIFADQAFSISAGLAASYVTGITLMPVLYSLFMRRKRVKRGERKNSTAERKDHLIAFYDKGIDFVFRHKRLSLIFVFMSVAALYPLFSGLRRERMPEIDSAETILAIDWNENVSPAENSRRVADLGKAGAVEKSAYIGTQGFMLNSSSGLSSSEAQVYFRTASAGELTSLKDSLSGILRRRYPSASFVFQAPENVFENVFGSDEAPLEARFSLRQNTDQVKTMARIKENIEARTGTEVQEEPLREQTDITPDGEKMALYGVSDAEVRRVLESAFKGRQSSLLRSFQEYIPVVVGTDNGSVERTVSETLVESSSGNPETRSAVPLSAVVNTSSSKGFKTIRADAGGEYVPVAFDCGSDEAPEIMRSVREIAAEEESAEVAFAGSIFSSERMMRELAVILAVSLVMMYFILCAQFESFLQPLIVLVEIPLDISFALAGLLIFGQTLNLMSAIGIIVTCGIVVNDSILKLDAINELRKEGAPLFEAIHLAGQRRLKAIIMTSLTTIFAMLPVLFTSDMGSELQRPLAIAMICSMVVGTLVSIFIIPLIYYLLYRGKIKKINAVS